MIATRPSVRIGAKPVAVVDLGPGAVEVWLFFLERCAAESAQWEKAERKRMRLQARVDDVALYASCNWEQQMQAQSRLVSLEREVAWLWGEASRHAQELVKMFGRLDNVQQWDATVASEEHWGTPLTTVLARLGIEVAGIGSGSTEVVPF